MKPNSIYLGPRIDPMRRQLTKSRKLPPSPKAWFTAGMKVAFQGVPGAYSELAAHDYFKKQKFDIVPCPEFQDVFIAVTKGKADWGVVPVENSLTGSIHQNFDLLLENRLSIRGELKLRISHSLLALPGASLKTIKHVYSHPQALWQCKKYISSIKGAKPVDYFDTAGSAKHVSELGDLTIAAVASKTAAAHYGLKELKAGIENNKKNFTRFFVLSKTKSKKIPRNPKTSIAFDLKSVPGALHKAIGVFADLKIQLFKVESRPIPGRPWEYIFYLDFAGDVTSKATQEALKALKPLTSKLSILGSYAESD